MSDRWLPANEQRQNDKMPLLDIRTAYLIAGLAALLCSSTVLILRKLHLGSRAATQLMGLAMAFGGICLVLASMRTSHSSGSYMWISLMCAGACFAFIVEAIRRLYGGAPGLGLCGMALAALGAGLALAPDAKSSLVIHFGFQALSSVLALLFTVLGRDMHANWGRYGLVVLFSCFSAAAAMRWFDAMNATQLTLASPDFRFGLTQGPAVLLYTLSPMVTMSLFIAILNSRQVAELTQIASTDELTGLASRRFLFNSAAAWREQRGSKDVLWALLMIDIDHFKSINDRFGHETGDSVLRHVSGILRAKLRNDAILARYGGEEFCVLLPVRSEDETSLAAERLRAAVQSAPCEFGSNRIEVTVSIGVAMHGHQETLQEVLRVADKRLYVAKAKGRNKVVFGEMDGGLVPV